MSRQHQLAQLARIARTRADQELRRFAAHRAQADAMRQHIEAVRAELSAAMAAPASDALDQWRLTTALVGYRAGELHRAEDALARMQPSLDAARSAAAKAFGRAEALSQLKELTVARDRADKIRRGG